MEEFMKQALLLSGIQVEDSDLPYLARQMEGLTLAAQALQFFPVNETVPLLYSTGGENE